MTDAEALLESVVLWCSPDYEAVATVVAIQTTSGFLRTFEPLPATISAVQSYLQCLGRRFPVPPTLEQSWDCFYRQYHPLVRWVIARSCHPSERDDLCQEIWAEIIVELPRLTNGSVQGDFSAWLAGLTRRKVGRVVHQQGASWMQGPLPIEDFRLASSDLGPDDECLLKEMWGQMDAALAKLRKRTSPASYELFYRRFFLEQSAKEIAAALGLTPNEVKCRYRRLKRKWRTLTKGSAAVQWGDDFTATDNSPLPRKPR